MEFEGVIFGPSQLELGSLSSVERRLREMFPEMTFRWSSTGLEKLADFDSRNVDIPLIVRRVLEAQPSFRCGEWSNDLVTVEVNCGPDDRVERIWLSISGNGRETKRVLSVIRDTGWSIEDEPLDVVEVAPNDEVTVKGNATLYVEKSVPKKPKKKPEK